MSDKVINIYNILIYNEFWRTPLIVWVIAIIATLIWFLNKASNTVSSLQTLKASFLIPISKRFKFKRLEKSAIKSDIQGKVNKVVDGLKKELPNEWIEDLSIKWVKDETKEEFLRDNKIVMRIMPLQKEESNYVKTLYFYFKNCFFPKTKNAIPDINVEATTLQICRRAIGENPKVKEVFDDEILEPIADKKVKVLGYLERLEKIDKRGFFTGILIREIHSIANEVKLTSKRGNLGSEFNDVLSHLEKFIEDYDKGNKGLVDYNWTRKGTVSSYGLILVAHPDNADAGKIGIYVSRAEEKASNGIDSLYVFGTANERNFANQVISTIKTEVKDYKLKETYVLHKDYRGEAGGIGALFVLKK